MIRTYVKAESAVHARLLVQYSYGMNSIAAEPTLVHESEVIKPLSPEKARTLALKRQKDDIDRLLKVERERQKIKKAQQQIFKAAH